MKERTKEDEKRMRQRFRKKDIERVFNPDGEPLKDKLLTMDAIAKIAGYDIEADDPRIAWYLKRKLGAAISRFKKDDQNFFSTPPDPQTGMQYAFKSFISLFMPKMGAWVYGYTTNELLAFEERKRHFKEMTTRTSGFMDMIDAFSNAGWEDKDLEERMRENRNEVRVGYQKMLIEFLQLREYLISKYGKKAVNG